MKYFIISLSFVLLLLTGCKDEDGRNYLDNLTYAVDSRTNICFALGYQTMAGIPCTEEVLKMASKIKNVDYYVDIKTELCFAIIVNGLANVKCTDEVKILIRK